MEEKGIHKRVWIHIKGQYVYSRDARNAYVYGITQHEGFSARILNNKYIRILIYTVDYPIFLSAASNIFTTFVSL